MFTASLMHTEGRQGGGPPCGSEDSWASDSPLLRSRPSSAGSSGGSTSGSAGVWYPDVPSPDEATRRLAMGVAKPNLASWELHPRPRPDEATRRLGTGLQQPNLASCDIGTQRARIAGEATLGTALS